jgi:hypothetical protein
MEVFCLTYLQMDKKLGMCPTQLSDMHCIGQFRADPIQISARIDVRADSHTHFDQSLIKIV